jgi:hypothetical protein
LPMNSSATAETFDARSATGIANAQIKTANRREASRPYFRRNKLLVLISNLQCFVSFEMGRGNH